MGTLLESKLRGAQTKYTLCQYGHVRAILRYIQPEERSPGRILLATDGSENTNAAARAAADISRKTDSELHVAYVETSLLGSNPSLTVISSFPASLEAAEDIYERNLQDALQVLYAGVRQVEKARGEVAQTHLRLGRPAREITALSKELEAGLVVMGRRRLGRLRRMVAGGVSRAVVRNSREAAVLVVPPGQPAKLYKP